MTSPRTPRSFATSTPTQQSEKRPFVYLCKIDFPGDEPKRIRVPKSFQELLRVATEVLGLRRPAVHLSDSKGNTLSDLAQIEPNLKVFVSYTVPPSIEVADPVYKLRMHQEKRLKAPQPVPRQQPKRRPPPENVPQHQALAASRLTVKDNLRDSLLSLYMSLGPAQKAQIASGPALEKLANDTQQYVVENSLLTQFIGPAAVIEGTELGQAATAWALKQLKALRPEQCRFAVIGPSQSGRSTLLSILVSIFSQKLQFAAQNRDYLIVPFNWSFYQIHLDDHPKLLEVFVSNTFGSLRGSRPEVIPLLDTLQHWFFSLLTTRTLPPLILPSLKAPDPPWLKPVLDVGRILHRCWNKKDKTWEETAPSNGKLREDDNFARFLIETVRFPVKIAAAFGFKSAVLVCDHFDVAAHLIHPSDHFPGQIGPVSLFEILSDVIKTTPFFVSAFDADQLQHLFRKFRIEDYRQLSTEGIIPKRAKEVLLVPQIQGLTLTSEMCRGCPAYCSLYDRVCQLAVEMQQRTIVKSQFPRLKSVVDVSRNEILKQEFIRLALLLAAADADGSFDEAKMNQVMQLPDYTVKVH
jgi:hypothetical protein